MIKKKVYVGKYGLRPPGVEELPPDKRRMLYPSRHDLPDVFWTNNPAILDEIHADELYVCLEPGNEWVRMDTIGEYKEYLRILSPGDYVTWLPLDFYNINPLIIGG